MRYLLGIHQHTDHWLLLAAYFTRLLPSIAPIQLEFYLINEMKREIALLRHTFLTLMHNAAASFILEQ